MQVPELSSCPDMAGTGAVVGEVGGRAPAPSLRRHLRSATRAAHEALDRRLSGFDLGRADDLGAFLLIHAAAVPPIESALARWDGAGLANPWRAGPLGRRLAADLAALGLDRPEPVRLLPGGPDGLLGLAYVLAGSRLGARHLRAGWARGRDPRARAAGRYLGGEDVWRYWPCFVRALDREGARRGCWDGVVAGARAGFDAFARAADRAEVPA